MIKARLIGKRSEIRELVRKIGDGEEVSLKLNQRIYVDWENSDRVRVYGHFEIDKNSRQDTLDHFKVPEVSRGLSGHESEPEHPDGNDMAKSSGDELIHLPIGPNTTDISEKCASYILSKFDEGNAVLRATYTLDKSAITDEEVRRFVEDVAEHIRSVPEYSRMNCQFKEKGLIIDGGRAFRRMDFELVA